MAKSSDQYSEKEAAERRDNALRRALSTPPKPKMIKPKKKSLKKKTKD